MTTKEANSAVDEALEKFRQRINERDRTLDQAIAGIALDAPVTGLALQSIVTELREQRREIARIVHMQTCKLGTACSDYNHWRLV